MTKEWFETWFDSPYYHMLYQHRDENEAQIFLASLIQKLAIPKQATILDLACGKGRFSVLLAKKDYQVVGVDISPQSIKFAQQFEHDRLSFYTHDMREVFRPNYFDYIFSFFTSFGYFETETEHLNTLKSIASGLKPNGTFVFDFLNETIVRKNLIAEDVKTIDNITFIQKRAIVNGFVTKKILFHDNGEENIHQEKVKLFSLTELKVLFQKAGLQIESIAGNYHLDPFDKESSKRLILIATKV